MANLSNKDRESRRVFDYKVVKKMNHRPYKFSAHATANDAESGTRAIITQTDARYACHYRAKFGFKTLIDKGKYNSPTIIRVDASDPGYPFKEPVCWVVEQEGSKTPWTPHFYDSLPVCIGSVWRSSGNVLLAHLFIHLARLLNFDEQLESGYGGYNAEAANWQREHLQGPLNPELIYPSLPVSELYGDVVVKKTSGFKARQTKISSFRSTKKTSGFNKVES